MKERKYKWLLFDLDHTLLDFEASSKDAFSALLKKLNYPEKPHHYGLYSAINKHVWYELETGQIKQFDVREKRFRLLFDILNIPFDASLANKIYFEYIASHSFFIDGAEALLKAVKPHYELCIVTNGMKDVQRPRISNTFLKDYFQHIVISDEIGVTKPYKPFFDHTIELIGFDKLDEILIIGDTLRSDIKGGVDYGIDTCWYNPENADDHLDLNPSYNISSLIQLQEILLD